MSNVAAILIGFLPDPRINKRIELEKNLMELHLICWDRGSEMQMVPSGKGYTVHQIKIDACGDPLKRLFPYKKFTKEAMKSLIQIKPELIDVQGLDMLEIAYKYKMQYNKDVRIIYEVADLHRLIVDKQRNPVRLLAQRYLRFSDRHCCKKIDLLMVSSPKYVETYFGDFVPPEKTMYFPNVPNLSDLADYRKKRRGEPFEVGFIGDIRYPEQMKLLIAAAKACKIKLMFAGFEQGGNEIETLCKEYSDGEWIGRFDFKTQAAKLYEKCDVIYSVYDADMENVKVALPNKLYEAVYCEVPIIVARNTYLAEVVNEWGVGVAVDHKSPNELIEVLKKMQTDEAYYNQFVVNCRKHKDEVDLEKYNEQLKIKLAGMGVEMSLA